jgi:hypothetical protein
LEEGYWRSYERFYSWKNILAAAHTKPDYAGFLRHAAYTGGWKKMEPRCEPLIKTASGADAPGFGRGLWKAYTAHAETAGSKVPTRLPERRGVAMRSAQNIPGAIIDWQTVGSPEEPGWGIFNASGVWVRLTHPRNAPGSSTAFMGLSGDYTRKDGIPPLHSQRRRKRHLFTVRNDNPHRTWVEDIRHRPKG